MTIRKLLSGAAVALALAVAAPSLANDSTAELAAGGLILTRDDDIEMRSEDLFISREEVVVKYRFFNTAAADKTVRVAFPMPDVEYSESDVGVPTEDPENLLGFRTLVDGREVEAHVEQKAILNGRDVTAQLLEMGVALQPHLRLTWDQMDSLPQAVRDRLVRDGYAGVIEYDDDGRGMKPHLIPRWVLKTTFHWEQTFPAGRELAVEHRYKPAAGGSAGTTIGSPYNDADEADSFHRQHLARYCVERNVIAAVEKRMRERGVEYPPYTETWIQYILKTGGNWKKPIGHFRLVIDKGEPDNLLSLCISGIRKISPTRFEVVRENWRPDQDLDILILNPARYD